jgi:hypothetical protein
MTLVLGGPLSCYTGSIDSIFEELAIIRPASFAFLPRLSIKSFSQRTSLHLPKQKSQRRHQKTTPK